LKVKALCAAFCCWYVAGVDNGKLKGPSNIKAHNAQSTGTAGPISLRDTLRKARIKAADRTGVVVDLRDTEVARLENLNEALNRLFAQVLEQIDLFDRGISHAQALNRCGGPRRDGPRQLCAGHPLCRTVLAESHDVRAISMR